jgi:hypothetical protein
VELALPAASPRSRARTHPLERVVHQFAEISKKSPRSARQLTSDAHSMPLGARRPNVRDACEKHPIGGEGVAADAEANTDSDSDSDSERGSVFVHGGAFRVEKSSRTIPTHKGHMRRQSGTAIVVGHDYKASIQLGLRR